MRVPVHDYQPKRWGPAEMTGRMAPFGGWLDPVAGA